MTNNNNPNESLQPDENSSQDPTAYELILRDIAELLRNTDFSADFGAVLFLAGSMENIYDPETQDRTVDRCCEVLTAMTLLLIELLEQFEDPNEWALFLADRADIQADEYSAMPKPEPIPNEEFQELLATNAHCTMSLEEFFQILELPGDERDSVIRDMIGLEEISDVSALVDPDITD